MSLEIRNTVRKKMVLGWGGVTVFNVIIALDIIELGVISQCTMFDWSNNMCKCEAPIKTKQQKED